MKRVVFIGIDSMDRYLVARFLDKMPTFKRIIKKQETAFKLTSVFPPDSDTAWASIYTGLNPAKHGVVDFVDPLEKAVNIQLKETSIHHLKGRTFWDIAGEARKKVCVLLPHICYPPWDVNGIMMSRSKIKDSILSVPELNSLDFDIKRLINPKGVPKKDEKSLIKLIQEYKDLVVNETEFFVKMIHENEWDLFFVYSSALDAIQHYFWNYCDEKDVEYPGDTIFKNVIEEFYILYDKMVHAILSQVTHDETTIFIMSDHGHGRRPNQVVNINEVLKNIGVLTASNTLGTRGLEEMKMKISEIIYKFNLGWAVSKFLKIVPQSKNLYSKPLSIDWKSTVAYTTDLSGIKAYTYGGIRINRNLVESEKNYDSLRSTIIQSLSSLNQEMTQKIIRWVLKREELYSGKEIDKFPDLVIQLEDNYGIGHRVNAPIIDKTFTSSVVPGSHKGDTPIFYILNHPKVTKTKASITLMDVAPSLLDILGINLQRFEFDGENFFR